MSSTSIPIPPHRFAEAIRELPLSNLHFKAAELRNSVAHLYSSNQQLQQYAAQGDHECAEAIRENMDVMKRMEERINMLRVEVEGRGCPWSEGDTRDARGEVNGDMNGDSEVATRHISRNSPLRPMDDGESTRSHNGRMGDDELRTRSREQLREVEDDEDENGVHL